MASSFISINFLYFVKHSHPGEAEKNEQNEFQFSIKHFLRPLTLLDLHVVSLNKKCKYKKESSQRHQKVTCCSVCLWRLRRFLSRCPHEHFSCVMQLSKHRPADESLLRRVTRYSRENLRRSSTRSISTNSFLHFFPNLN